LQGFWKLNQFTDVISKELFRANGKIDIKIISTKYLGMFQLICGENARNFGRGVIQTRGKLAGHHVNFVALRNG
jgi:hypothetical protein